ncbi:MAG: hypothetical protein AAGH82_02605 [Pseudomonadota bacterium]
MAAQLPLDIGGQPSFRREDVVITKANQAAVAFVDAWPNWPAPVTMLVGPQGSGKTHLARVWQGSSRAVQLNGEELSVSDFENPNCYLLEDIDRARLDETALFHLINAVRQTGKHLLLTSRQPVGALPFALPDLVSRMRAVAIAALSPPDDALLEGVLRKLTADRQIMLDDATVHYLVVRMERSLAAAGELIERLDHIALVEKRPITRPLAARVLDALRQPRPDA